MFFRTMGFLSLLVVASATYASKYSVIRYEPYISDGRSTGRTDAVMTAECPLDVDIPVPTSTLTDVVIAVDTSFCNHYRIQQVKSTVNE